MTSHNEEQREMATQYGWGKYKCCSKWPLILRKAEYQVYLCWLSCYFCTQNNKCEKQENTTHVCGV